MIVIEFTYFFQFLVAHMLCDFVLQHEAMSMGKHRKHDIHKNRSPLFPPWYYWLSAHSLIHGGAVFLITNNLWLGIAETLLHGTIDFLKCERKINLNQDQFLHIICKVAYCFYI